MTWAIFTLVGQLYMLLLNMCMDKPSTNEVLKQLIYPYWSKT